ncbi:MAG: Crp/Fnr family transcriptional regulator [Bacteroides sp.]|nr:Crp/Fnr family transcriptional regulator [Roseburia sp.]MCM1347494.1 Crp/Fnr family transcriptional regulator [Bacteroides sp.]MCM1421972.1 Crp/Fnr family transcriptional regulator [Bacteroides sp.]
MEFTMFEKLQLLPLFQGLSINELSYLLERVKLNFNQHAANTIIASQDDCCDKLIYILDGTICAEHKNTNDRFIITEYLDAPHVIEPYNMFGMSQRYSHTYRFVTEGSTFSIDKRVFCDILMDMNIIKMNMLNMICYRLQLATSDLRAKEASCIEYKIRDFIKAYITRPSGSKVITVKMEDFATILNETRLGVSKALNMLEKKGIVKLKRREIHIPDIKFLLNYKLND